MSDQDYGRQLQQLQPSPRDEQPARTYTQPTLRNPESNALEEPSPISLLSNKFQSTSPTQDGPASAEGDSPDDFYRGYEKSTVGRSFGQGTTSKPRIGELVSPQQSPAISNGNGVTPRHPRPTFASGQRTASAPRTDRISQGATRSTPNLNGPTKTRQVSGSKVSELSKRFDQNVGQNVSLALKVPSKVAPRDATNFAVSSRKQVVNENGPKPTRIMPRSKFAMEDQHSNNTLSGIARPVRTRNDTPAKAQTSQQPPTFSPPRPPKIPLHLSSRRPLFGEILPDPSGTSSSGYGIDAAKPRRTSDPNLHLQTTLYQPDNSDGDAGPGSPTTWYRDASSAQHILASRHTQSPSRTHNRSQSDSAGRQRNNSADVPMSESPVRKKVPKTSPPPSRLPVMTRRRQTSNSSDSSSVQSSSATSPLSSKATSSNARVFKSEQRSAGRAITPTPRPAGHQIVSSSKVLTDEARLKAYISVSPPQKSPPLRRSRDRNSVTTATPASSKSRTIENNSFPLSDSKSTRRTFQESKSNARLRPSDFPALRARIHQGIDNAMQENGEKALPSPPLDPAALDGHDVSDDYFAGNKIPLSHFAKSTTMTESNIHPKLSLDTGFFSSNQPGTDMTPQNVSTQAFTDSPTLGMPGSFPESQELSYDDAPHSAISAVTGITEFDHEAQFDARRQTHLSVSTSQYLNPSQYPTDDNGSIRIILDSSSFSQTDGEAEPTRHDGGATFLLSASDQATSATNTPADIPLHQAEILPHSSKDVSHLDPHMNGDNEPNAHALLGEMIASELHESGRASSLGKHQVEEESYSPTNESPTLPLHSSSTDAPLRRLTIQTSLADQYSTANGPTNFPDSPVTDIEYESSEEVGESFSTLHDSSSRLRLDKLSEAPSRPISTSRQSIWTNYTNNSQESNPVDQYESQLLSLPITEYRPPPPPKVRSSSPRPEVPPKPPSYSPQPSPRVANHSPMLATSGPLHHGESLSIAQTDFSLTNSGRNSPVSSTAPTWPNHPPPAPPRLFQAETSSSTSSRTPPPVSFYNRRPQSSVYQSSSTVAGRDSESRRASEEAYSIRPSISTPRSSTQISFGRDTSLDESSFGHSSHAGTSQDAEASESALKALHHRWHVINELIGTEAAYLKDMNVIEEIYKGTAEACPNLETGDVDLLFRNSDQIIAFSTAFLADLKTASAGIYATRSQKSRQSRITNASASSGPEDSLIGSGALEETDFDRDRRTKIGKVFTQHFKHMQVLYTAFLEKQERADHRLQALQADRTASVWLGECDAVAADLTQSWNLSSLLIKPFQRITKYPLLLESIRSDTPQDHPDYQALSDASSSIKGLCMEINMYKANDGKSSQTSSVKKSKEADLTGLFKTFANRRGQDPVGRQQEDAEYIRHHDRFSDDYVRLQVVLRDVEFYTRQCSVYVQEFVQYLSAIELVMRVGPGTVPELESKWIRFSMSMHDMETHGLEDHISMIKKRVIAPMEKVIKAYEGPSLAMKQRTKRRPDHEKYESVTKAGKKIDDKLEKLEEQFQTLSSKLKDELPKLSAMTNTIGQLCLRQFVAIMAQWFDLWQRKMRTVLEDSELPSGFADILDKFHRDFRSQQEFAQSLSILNGKSAKGSLRNRLSQVASRDDDVSSGSRSKPSTLSGRTRGVSINNDQLPSLPTPDFGSQPGPFTFSPLDTANPSLPRIQTQDFSRSQGNLFPGSNVEALGTSDLNAQFRPHYVSPNTGRSYDSGGTPREFRELGDTLHSAHESWLPSRANDADSETRPTASIFNSAMPMDDNVSGATTRNGVNDSQRSSRQLSFDRERLPRYQVIWLAASLFEFQIDATKTEAGYPYLTYPAGEIFDVLAEKGELWLAKNQDDNSAKIGWIWSKHFARLAAD
ncbi:MAG: hypothetical protein M1818_004531 [Claussenomyces sp. TS43310]|nr:MAG: hypothetical protein M1818_004531 [Claussenomyces sp. TS43310]